MEKVYVINKESYRELDCIGEGNYGQVMLVQHIKTEKEYALKIIPCKHEAMTNYYEAEYLVL